MVSATMIWLATLVVWPSPLPPTSVMFLPISSNSGLTLLERRLRAADHDGQRGRLGADLAAGDRRVEIVAAELVDPRGELLGLDRRDRAHVDDDLAGLSPSATPPGPNSTASTCGVSGTMVMMTSACSATSWPDAQATAALAGQLVRQPA